VGLRLTISPCHPHHRIAHLVFSPRLPVSFHCRSQSRPHSLLDDTNTKTGVRQPSKILVVRPDSPFHTIHSSFEIGIRHILRPTKVYATAASRWLPQGMSAACSSPDSAFWVSIFSSTLLVGHFPPQSAFASLDCSRLDHDWPTKTKLQSNWISAKLKCLVSDFGFPFNPSTLFRFLCRTYDRQYVMYVFGRWQRKGRNK